MSTSVQALASVALGGALGASARYGLMVWLGPVSAAGAWPLPVLVANLLGCLAAGGLFAWFATQPPAPTLALLLSTGLLGGFTTFSAFSVDTLELLLEGRVSLALGYAATTLIGCLLAVSAGWLLGQRLLQG